MTPNEIEALAYEALDAAAVVIQEKLGVKTGDAAGVFFCDDVALDNLIGYINFELSLAKDNKPG